MPEAVVNLENENEKEQYLDTMFDRWMIALEVAMTILFPIEQQLCDRILSGFSAAVSLIFAKNQRFSY